MSIGCSNSLRMQLLKNRAAHIIQRRATTEEAFKMLGCIDLETQRKAHKCILNDLFVGLFYYTYKTRQRIDIHLPTPKLTIGKNTLRFSGVVLFNDLPASVKEALSLSIFKNSLSCHVTH